MLYHPDYLDEKFLIWYHCYFFFNSEKEKKHNKDLQCLLEIYLSEWMSQI